MARQVFASSNTLAEAAEALLGLISPIINDWEARERHTSSEAVAFRIVQQPYPDVPRPGSNADFRLACDLGTRSQGQTMATLQPRFVAEPVVAATAS